MNTIRSSLIYTLYTPIYTHTLLYRIYMQDVYTAEAVTLRHSLSLALCHYTIHMVHGLASCLDKVLSVMTQAASAAAVDTGKLESAN